MQRRNPRRLQVYRILDQVGVNEILVAVCLCMKIPVLGEDGSIAVRYAILPKVTRTHLRRDRFDRSAPRTTPTQLTTFSQQMQTIRPGERVSVQLPANCGVIQSVDLDYGRQLVDRTTARLQIIPKNEQRYEQPRYTYQQPQVQGGWSHTASYPQYQQQPV